MITLIGTVHNECGLCNPNQLYKIIERIAPDVILEETPPRKFRDVYREMSNSDFRKKCTRMFNTFSYYSHNYNNLLNERTRLTEKLGFPYLNSEACSELMERIHLLEELMVQKINNDELFQVRKMWLDFIDRRRNEMIKNIYNYIDINHCEKALFLVGIEHKNPIIQKIANSWKVDWNFNYLG